MIHVYPIEDLRDHVTDGGACWCNPTTDDDEDLVIHNAMDGREKIETGEAKTQ